MSKNLAQGKPIVRVSYAVPAQIRSCRLVNSLEGGRGLGVSGEWWGMPYARSSSLYLQAMQTTFSPEE